MREGEEWILTDVGTGRKESAHSRKKSSQVARILQVDDKEMEDVAEGVNDNWTNFSQEERNKKRRNKKRRKNKRNKRRKNKRNGMV